MVMHIKTLRRSWLCLLLAALAASPALAQPSPARRPNVVVILADDQGYETISANGGSSYQTPSIDRMAAEGLRLTNAYAHPLCTPSRVALMTGRYNFRNYTSFGELSRQERTIGHMFRDAGYKTLIAGKWQLSETDYESPHHFGFDEYILWNFGQQDRGSRYWDPRFFRNGRLLADTAGRFGPDIMADVVAEFINRNRAEPFFVYYPLVLPHDPWVDPPGYKPAETASPQERQQHQFGAMVSYVDKMVGRVIDQLDALKLSDSTLVIFTGDNGTFPSLQSVLNGQVIKGDKGAPTQAGTHVPFIARWKGHVPAGKAIDDLVDFTDIMPTLAEIAAIPLPVKVAIDGRSFAPQLRGRSGKPREWIYCYYDPRWANFRPSTYAQDKQYKLYSDGRLFDYRADPREATPINQSETREQAAARSKLQRVIDDFAAQGARGGGAR